MIAAIQKMKSTFAAGLFAALVISSTPVFAGPSVSTAPSATPAVTSSYSDYLTVGNAAWFTFFLMLTRLWTREGDTAPVKYNLDELAIGENVANNLYYLVDDGVIGHFGKKPYLTVDTDNSRVEVALGDAEDANGKPIKDAQGNKIKVSTACYPKGLMGWAAYYYKPLMGAMGVTVFFKELIEATAEANATNRNLMEVLTERLNKKYGATLKKFTDLGTAPFIAAVGGILVGAGLSK